MFSFPKIETEKLAGRSLLYRPNRLGKCECISCQAMRAARTAQNTPQLNCFKGIRTHYQIPFQGWTGGPLNVTARLGPTLYQRRTGVLPVFSVARVTFRRGAYGRRWVAGLLAVCKTATLPRKQIGSTPTPSAQTAATRRDTVATSRCWTQTFNESFSGNMLFGISSPLCSPKTD